MVAIAKQGLECIIQISLGNSLILSCCVKAEDIKGQECILVGCIPSAAVTAGEGGVSQHALSRVCVYQHALDGGVVFVPMHAGIYTPLNRMTDRQV